MNTRNNASSNFGVEVSRFEVCWWNGGGGILKRLKVNPILSKLLNELPDIFTYGESLLTKSSGLFLSGYKFILHRSYIKDRDNYRRGMVIFCREKYQYNISKVFASKIFDIVWIWLKLENEAIYFCFFYAPAEHLLEKIRLEFYNTFTANFAKYSAKRKVFLLGDSNATLGTFLNGFDIHGKPISNKNKPLFLGFLEYSVLTLMNKKYCLGIPTYKIVNKKQSSIDFALTNSEKFVDSFHVVKKNIGVSPQSCHRLLKIIIKLKA